MSFQKQRATQSGTEDGEDQVDSMDALHFSSERIFQNSSPRQPRPTPVHTLGSINSREFEQKRRISSSLKNDDIKTNREERATNDVILSKDIGRLKRK